MKKVLSVALALTMMLLVCVPAFAATITQDSDKSANVDVVTKTTDKDGNPAASFTVSIPTAVEIPWYGTTGGDYLNWSYSSQLEIGKQLQISLDKTGGALTNGTADSLAYTLSGDAVGTAFETGEEVTEGTVYKQIEVAVSGWDDAAVAAYSDTVTFTVAVVDL